MKKLNTIEQQQVRKNVSMKKIMYLFVLLIIYSCDPDANMLVSENDMSLLGTWRFDDFRRYDCDAASYERYNESICGINDLECVYGTITFTNNTWQSVEYYVKSSSFGNNLIENKNSGLLFYNNEKLIRCDHNANDFRCTDTKYWNFYTIKNDKLELYMEYDGRQCKRIINLTRI